MRNSPERDLGATAAKDVIDASGNAKIRGKRAANRRVVLKAAAGMAALAASGVGVVPGVAPPAVAQQADGTRARRHVPAENGVGSSEAAQGQWITFQAEFPFWALGASWPSEVGLWPVIAVQLSDDGATWSETIDIPAQTEDGGQPSRDGRLFTALIFTEGAQWVRYQTVDIDRVPGEVDGLAFVYIDPTDGPWEEDLAVGSSSRLSTLATDTIAPPEIITRAQWGANESWRFDTFGEIWPPEYEPVTHLILHHTATANRPADVPNAIRSIYYYHAVEQGWGDIGYNYLVDHNGRIYQGRFGGQDVIGGHSYQFAIGSSGISTIGNFQSVDITEAAKSALVSICAFVGRDLDPLATADFKEAPNLPIIASHRDVNATSCPGDRLWNDLPEIRTLVAQTLDEGVLETGFPAGIAPGDRVRVQTDDGSALNLRSSANGLAIGSIADDATAWVIDGPEKLTNGNWYRLDPEGSAPTGWATAQFLIVEPPLPPGSPTTDYPFGLNLRFVSAANIRRSPSTTAGIVGTAPTNGWAHVMAGPVDAEGYTWYQVRAQNIGDGWVVRDLIAPAPFNENPDGDFNVDDTVEATQTINLRPRPGLAQGVISTLGAGSPLVISQPPVEVTGFIWYGVYSSTVGGGWVVEDYLRLRSSGPPPSGKFAINDTFRVTETTNLRSTPSTSGSVVVTMGVGTIGTIVGGSRAANGYTWWQVRLANGTTGWCIENWLVETDGGTTPPPPTSKFQVNDTFRVTETMNLRSSASTSGSVVASMAVGTTGIVIGGPMSANGYIWWNVRLTNGTTG
nr:SH3 domain-containing protein [Chloroflexia bacterium]